MLDKHYQPSQVEGRVYEIWEASGAFRCGGDAAKPYTIVIPPPNVTGSLHMGHALNNTLQDIMIRLARMRGNDTLWQPGTDHAGIATQMVVERQLNEEGKSREDLGRADFVDRVWQWKGGIRRHHYRAIASPRRLLRLGPGALHHGRGAIRRRPEGVSYNSTKKA